jgi:hypothetical protein
MRIDIIWKTLQTMAKEMDHRLIPWLKDNFQKIEKRLGLVEEDTRVLFDTQEMLLCIMARQVSNPTTDVATFLELQDEYLACMAIVTAFEKLGQA